MPKTPKRKINLEEEDNDEATISMGDEEGDQDLGEEDDEGGNDLDDELAALDEMAGSSKSKGGGKSGGSAKKKPRKGKA